MDGPIGGANGRSVRVMGWTPCLVLCGVVLRLAHVTGEAHRCALFGWGMWVVGLGW